jgi:lysophospholipase L1-like esterase
MSAYRGFALVAALGAVFFAVDSASAADTPAAEKVIVVPQSIGRSLEKLRKEKNLKIAYFGGSISSGRSVADSWRARTTAWFRKRAPEAKITEVDATAEGGSEYGAFRIRKDLIETDPDLVFIEFAVDDAGRDEQRTLRSFEGIVRHFWTVNPWAEIVIVHTTTKQLAPGYEAGAGPKTGAVPKAVGLHKSIAKHYGIPEIDLGLALVDETKTGKNTWESLTTDGVHPNAAGSAVCFRAIEAFLEAHAGEKAAEPVVVLPSPLTKDPFHGAFVIKGSTLYAPGWTKVPKPPEVSQAATLPPHLEGEAVGSELTHVFTGSAVGLFLLTGQDCGEIEWSVDGGAPKRLSTFDAQAGVTGRIRCVILADDLKSGAEHTLLIRILPEKAPQATGTKIRIAAVFMHCDC